MSFNYYWEPVEQKGRSLDVDAERQFGAVMEHIYGPFPIMLSKDNLSELRAMGIMARVVSGNLHRTTVYEKLSNLIMKHDRIEINREG